MSEVTMAILTEDEKNAIDDSPDQTLKFLFNSIIEHGSIPSYFDLIFLPKNKPGYMQITHFEGDKVLAALDYVDYLVAQGIRTDPYE